MGSLMAFLGVVKGVSQEPSKYSLEWIKRLSDVEWKKEREIIWQNYCNLQYDEDTRSEFRNLLRLFDKVKNDRDWDGMKPKGPAYHREHGYNLYKP